MNIKKLPKKCHCGKDMHLSDSQKVMIRQLGKSWPEYKKVEMLNGKAFKVPTYYIILHTKEITFFGFEKKGFPEWPPESSIS